MSSRYVETNNNLDPARQEYFANQEVEKCVSRCIDHIDTYFLEMNRTGRINIYRNSYFKYFQGFILKGAIFHSGQEGELSNTYINHYGNLVTHTVNMVCQQKIAYEPQATVSDAQAQDQIKQAKGILFVYSNDVKADLGGKLRLSTEMSTVFGESYVSALWNKELGRTLATDYDEESGEISINEGDNEIEVWTPFDIIIDVNLADASRKQWLILRRWENKFDVAARYPDWAKEIVSLSTAGSLGETQLTYSLTDENDILPVYYFIHKKTTSVPTGRLTIFIDDHVILADGKNPYRNAEIPVFRMAARELWGSPFGYTRAFDALPMQEMVDRLTSAILTNELTFAIQNVLIARGSSISWENLFGGLNVIEWDSSLGEAGKPSSLQLTSSPPETFTFIDKTIQNMGTIMGVNEVVRGNPDLVLKGQVSGAALALMSSNSITFNSDLQQAYVRLAEQVATQIIYNLQDFGFPDMGEQQPMNRQGMSMSATKKYFNKQYGKQDIDKIDRIVVKYGNPLAQTISGRMQIAEWYKDMGLLKTPADMEQVLETGSLEPATEAIESEMHLIKEENEALLRGEQVPVLWADVHTLHFPEHLAKIANLEARNNPKVLQAFKNHLDQHQQFMQPAQPVPQRPPQNQPQPQQKPAGGPKAPPAQVPQPAGVPA